MTWDPQTFEEGFRDRYPALVRFLHGLTGTGRRGKTWRKRPFIRLVSSVPIRTTVESFPLERANEALARLRGGSLRGAPVLAVAAP